MRSAPQKHHFCHKCGAKVVVHTPEPEPTPDAQEQVEPAQEKLPQVPRKRISRNQLVVVATLIGALVVAAGSYGVVAVNQQQREERLAAEAAAEAEAEKRRLESETLADAFEPDQLANSIPNCEQIANFVSADEEKWKAAASAFDGVGDPREAARVLATVRSANGTLEDADVDAYVEGFENGVLGFLDDLFASSTRDDSAPAGQIGRWETEWLSLARNSCPSEFETFDSTLASLEASAGKFSRISTLASQVPWYPEGYQEALPGIAVKWVDAGYDCYRCYQWDLDFVSQSRCDSVYAEIDLLDSSGRVIGWTNDTLRSVRPGEVGRLTFKSTVAVEL
jgi:hypothetical protein